MLNYRLNITGKTPKAIISNVSLPVLSAAREIHKDPRVLGIAANQIIFNTQICLEQWVLVLGQLYVDLKVHLSTSLLSSSTISGHLVSAEGCLSIPMDFGSFIVKRPMWLVISYKSGESVFFTYIQGPLAAIYNHEADHLCGITINMHGVYSIGEARKKVEEYFRKTHEILLNNLKTGKYIAKDINGVIYLGPR